MRIADGVIPVKCFSTVIHPHPTPTPTQLLIVWQPLHAHAICCLDYDAVNSCNLSRHMPVKEKCVRQLLVYILQSNDFLLCTTFLGIWYFRRQLVYSVLFTCVTFDWNNNSLCSFWPLEQLLLSFVFQLQSISLLLGYLSGTFGLPAGATWWCSCWSILDLTTNKNCNRWCNGCEYIDAISAYWGYFCCNSHLFLSNPYHHLWLYRNY